MHTGLPGILFIRIIIGSFSYRDNLPDTLDYTKFSHRYIRTVTVQLPMRVLHGMCYGRAPSGNDQLPKVGLHNY